MKKAICVLLAVVMTVLSMMSVGALATSSGIELKNDHDDQLMIIGYTGSDPVMVIPETAYNRNIVRFDNKAFYQNQIIEKVIMHDNMTLIREWAFNSCKNLRDVYYSKSLVAIDNHAFAYSDKLRAAFLLNTKVNTIEAGAYMKSGIEHLSFPDTLKSLCGAAFEGTNMRSVVIPDGVTHIDARCFADCANLERIYIPASVTRLNEDVFLRDNKLTVYTTENSAAHTYCLNNNINYRIISENEFPSRLLGDTNGDGELDINDVTYIQRELAGYYFDFYDDNCDFNGDCIFNINDATDIQYRLVGLK